MLGLHWYSSGAARLLDGLRRDTSDARLIKSAIQDCGIATSLYIAIAINPILPILPKELLICHLPPFTSRSARKSFLPLSDAMLAGLLSTPRVSSVAIDLDNFDAHTASIAATALKANENITRLDFHEAKQVGDSVTAIFCRHLPRNLVWLRFSFGHWENVSLENQWHMLNGIRELPCLKSLLLRFCFLSDAPMKEFLKYLRTTTVLEHVRLETDGDLSGVCEALEANASIEHVEIFKHRKMGQETGRVLGTFLRQNRCMKKFASCQFTATNEGLSEFVKGLALSQSLCELELDMCLSAGQLQILLRQGVQMAQGIKKLDLRVQEPLDFAVLCSFLKTNTTLTSLTLNLVLRQYDVCELLSSIQTSHTLEELYIPSNLPINVDTSTSLQCLTNLRVLGVPSLRSGSYREENTEWGSDLEDLFDYSSEYDDTISSLELNLSLFEVRGNFADISEQQQGKLDRIFRRNRLLASPQQGQGNGLPTKLWPVLFEWTLRNEEVGPSCVFGYLHKCRVGLICE